MQARRRSRDGRLAMGDALSETEDSLLNLHAAAPDTRGSRPDLQLRGVAQLLNETAAQIGQYGAGRVATGADAENIGEIVDPAFLGILIEHGIVHVAQGVHIAPAGIYWNKMCEISALHASHKSSPKSNIRSRIDRPQTITDSIITSTHAYGVKCPQPPLSIVVVRIGRA